MSSQRASTVIPVGACVEMESISSPAIAKPTLCISPTPSAFQAKRKAPAYVVEGLLIWGTVLGRIDVIHKSHKEQESASIVV